MNFKETADFLDENAGIWVGVSDKKLLWRANLYIDERKNEDGTWVNGEAADRINKTLAPIVEEQRSWNNYIPGDLVPGSNPANWTAPVIDNATRYPYRPVLTSVTNKTYNGINLVYDSFQVGYSSGVDCYGHLQRIACYSGNNYRLRDFSSTVNGGDGDRLEWGETYGAEVYESLDGIIANSWLIEAFTSRADTIDQNTIIPGDIITMDGHVAVISKIGYFENTRNINPQSVKIIECTSPRGEWKVMSDNTRTLQYFINSIYISNTIPPSGWVKNLNVRRLIID